VTSFIYVSCHGSVLEYFITTFNNYPIYRVANTMYGEVKSKGKVVPVLN